MRQTLNVMRLVAAFGLGVIGFWAFNRYYTVKVIAIEQTERATYDSLVAKTALTQARLYRDSMLRCGK